MTGSFIDCMTRIQVGNENIYKEKLSNEKSVSETLNCQHG